MMDYMPDLLKSHRENGRWLCKLLGYLAHHLKSTGIDTIIAEHCVQNWWFPSDMITSYGVYRMAKFLDCAQAAVDARILDRLPVMLKFQNVGVRRLICELLGALACHKTSAAAVVGTTGAVEHLVSLLRDEHPWVIESAAHALAQLAQWPCGAQAAVAAMVLDCIDDLFRSPNATVLHHTCWIIARLACHDTLTTAVATLAVNPCVQLVFLLWQASNSGYLDPGTRGRFGSSTQNIVVTESATAALCELVKSPEGAQSAVDARVLEYIGDLLRSPNPVVWMLTCCMLGRMTCHQATATAVLAIHPAHHIVCLLREENPSVIESAVEALCWIAQWPDGAKNVVDAHMLYYVGDLLESPSSEVRRWTCLTLGTLASRESTSTSTVILCADRLVSLLRGENPKVVEGAAYALCRISQSPCGAHATLNAGILNSVEQLIESPNDLVRQYSCCILGRIAYC
ncbi:armadillo-type protein [Mycena rosella]|uniref:Vacuolar protein 8 n=1 Tax=Mycena rosella TaxID=1033263 RepID=A0AAD7DRT1_MYCRO|nr:armadillo-type protein [Mycena rosella]